MVTNWRLSLGPHIACNIYSTAETPQWRMWTSQIIAQSLMGRPTGRKVKSVLFDPILILYIISLCVYIYIYIYVFTLLCINCIVTILGKFSSYPNSNTARQVCSSFLVDTEAPQDFPQEIGRLIVINAARQGGSYTTRHGAHTIDVECECWLK